MSSHYSFSPMKFGLEVLTVGWALYAFGWKGAVLAFLLLIKVETKP